ncbi:site-specific integrase [Nonomuraea sp. FMUSA5-5]|uniref:Site-specific integrase n=1 Tax=Nonomuraea composti TaxID=2720023 RepID=A0ABX1B823_9ACTN|nr:site-specific integrase [Nonomuraea sp. FMUSA5-5]NJP93955.1 site-specific integrase [Nonomuraea sp. FMUSA5-5]
MAKPVKRCNCRDSNGKKLGQKCPKLTQRAHGAWWGRYEAPPGPDGKRRRPWAGPYKTSTEAATELRRLQTEADSGLPVPDRRLTFGAWLDMWIAGKRRLKDSTRESYEEAIRLYGKPGLGHVPLDQLRESHLEALYLAMGQINNLPFGEKPSEMLRRLLAARAAAPWVYRRDAQGNRLKEKLPAMGSNEAGPAPGMKSKKPLSPARIQRVHRVLSSALGTAFKQKRIKHNPAEHVELPKARRVRPLVWTDERIARWRETGRVPGPVMVWTPAIAGAFLDACVRRGERLYPLYHLVTTRGLRRGEVCGIRWEDSDLSVAKTIMVLETDDEDDDGLKSESSWRTVAVGGKNATLLSAWRVQQMRERLAAGEDWVDTGLIFTAADGSPLREEYVSERFAAIVDGEDLPPIRLHDLRHCAATIMLAAGVDMKDISATLGHSRYGFTADVYTSVVPDVAQAAADATIAAIPRAIHKHDH